MLKKLLGIKNQKKELNDYFGLFNNSNWHNVAIGNINSSEKSIDVLERDNSFYLTLKVSPINTDFLTDEDFQFVTSRLNVLYNGLTDFSIYVYKEPVDYNDYISFHESVRNKCTDITIERKQNNFIQYIQNQTKSNSIKSNKVFYITYRFNNLKEFNTQKEIIEKNFKEALLDIEYLNKEDLYKIIYKRICKSDFLSKEEIIQEDLLPQNAIDYKGFYQIIDGTYHKQLVISNYNEEIKLYSWFKAILDINEEINISINCKKITPNVLIDNLDKQISHIRHEISTKDLKESEKNQKETILKNSQDISKKMMSSTSSLFDTEIIIDIEAISEEELSKKIQAIKQIIKSIGLNSMEVNKKRFDGFIATLPLSKSLNYMWNLTSEDVAAIIPFDSNVYFDDKGIVIGKNPTTQIPYSVDFFHSKYFNPHLYILGTTGSGKTYAITTIIERMKPFVDTVIKFDIAGVLHTSDSKRYIFSSEGNVILNPFYIRFKTKKSLNSGVLRTLNFFTDVAEFNKKQIDLLAHYIKVTFVKNGLTSEGFNTSYKEVTFTDFSKVITYRKDMLLKEKMAITENFTRNKVEAQIQDPSTDSGKEALIKLSTDQINFDTNIAKIDDEINDIIYILSQMNSFINGAYSRLFNGINNFEYEKDTVLDLSKLDKIMVSPVYKLLANDTWQYCIKDGTRDKNPNIPLKLVIYDEEHEFISDEVLLSTISKKFAKQGRKYGIATIHASQDFNDTAQNIEAQAILSNCNFKIILRIGGNDYSSVKKYFRFSDKEMKEITGSSLTQKILAKGRGIFVVDNLHLPYQLEASHLEHKEITEVLGTEEEDNEKNII